MIEMKDVFDLPLCGSIRSITDDAIIDNDGVTAYDAAELAVNYHDRLFDMLIEVTHSHHGLSAGATDMALRLIHEIKQDGKK